MTNSLQKMNNKGASGALKNRRSAPEVARVSPGLVAGYFAGGKWSEPPAPATLPRPPPHWTQLMFSPTSAPEITTQLKVLLNVQA